MHGKILKKQQKICGTILNFGEKEGGELPKAQTGWGWLDDAITTAGNVYDQTSNIVNTGMKRAGITSVAPYIGSTAASILRCRKFCLWFT